MLVNCLSDSITSIVCKNRQCHRTVDVKVGQSFLKEFGCEQRLFFQIFEKTASSYGITQLIK